MGSERGREDESERLDGEEWVVRCAQIEERYKCISCALASRAPSQQCNSNNSNK